MSHVKIALTKHIAMDNRQKTASSRVFYGVISHLLNEFHQIINKVPYAHSRSSFHEVTHYQNY